MKKVLLAMLVCNVLILSCDNKREPECDENSHGGYTWKNNSNKRINPKEYWIWPDTTIGEYNPTGFGVVEPGSTSTRGIPDPKNRTCMESLYKDGIKTYYFIFDEDSLEVIPWDTVRATNRGLLERREVDLKYFIDHDFILTYP